MRPDILFVSGTGTARLSSATDQVAFSAPYDGALSWLQLLGKARDV